MLESVLVANRGEIARRIIRTADAIGVRAIAVYSEADADLPYVREADQAIHIGPARAQDSYLAADNIIRAAKESGAAAIHPGYGFLAENADFARRVTEEGLVWVGPSADAMDAMAHKIRARNLIQEAGVPVAPGTSEPAATADAALAAARSIGYPVMVKPAAGGGGVGMSVTKDETELRKAFELATNRGTRLFGDPGVLLERYISGARHVEVQILGLADGTVLALGERDCSVQRRHQKVIEEAPSSILGGGLRARLLDAAVRAGQAVGYRNAGTVECLVDRTADEFYFIEMNTRLQVEHPLTELLFGVDLVEEQLRVASGLGPSFDPSELSARGHALELRVYAEDPKRFLPSPGKIEAWQEPKGAGVRVDSGYEAGNSVTTYYDPLLAKVCVHADDRESALQRAREAVSDFVIEGPKTNLAFLDAVLVHEEFVAGEHDTKFVDRMLGSAR